MDDKNKETEAQKRATAKYRSKESGKVLKIGLNFFPKDHDLYHFAKSKERTTAYILRLIREDMNRENRS